MDNLSQQELVEEIQPRTKGLVRLWNKKSKPSKKWYR